MDDPDTRAAAALRFRQALDLQSAGISMMRAKLRRDDPGAEEALIEARLRAWLHERPGAEFGDAVGRVRPMPDHWR